jgi:hypothetical protein
MSDRRLGRAAFVGALVGAGLFLGATLLEGGLRPCVGDALWDPAFDIANAPARAVATLWSSPAIAPQQKGWMCVSVRAEAWSAGSFAALGGAAYAAVGAVLFAFGRFFVGDGVE